MTDQDEPRLIVETGPDPEEVRFLEEQLHDFGVAATGIADGQRFGVFLRGAGGRVAGGAYGWTWGGTCYLRYLFVPANMRRQGRGTELMHAVEQEALDRRCSQILLETHDFQGPDIYLKLGFAVIGWLRGTHAGIATSLC